MLFHFWYNKKLAILEDDYKNIDEPQNWKKNSKLLRNMRLTKVLW